MLAVLLGASPWRRGPLLLFRTPGVFIACAVAMAVLAMAASSGVLFLSSAGTAALHNEAALECPEASQPGITNDQGPARLPTAAQTATGLQRGNASVRAAMFASGLPAPYLVAESTVPISSDQADDVTLFARQGAVSHVDVVSEGAGSGVWVPQSFATARNLHVGSRLALGTGVAPVVGIYRDLAPSAFVPLFELPRYWCTWQQQIVPTPFNRPPPLLITDLPTLEATGSTITATWYEPGRVESATVPKVERSLSATSAAVSSLNPHGTSTYQLVTDLKYLLAKAERERTGLRGAVVPIDIAGILVAALLVAAAGTFWGVRRQRELQLLGSRGVGKPAVALKAALEAAPAIALGTICGWLGSIAACQDTRTGVPAGARSTDACTRASGSGRRVRPARDRMSRCTRRRDRRIRTSIASLAQVHPVGARALDRERADLPARAP